MSSLTTKALTTTMLAGAAALAAGCAATTDAPMTEASAGAAMADADCAPDGALAYVCGVENGEDIVAVGVTEWLVASNMGGLGGPPGAGVIYLVNAETKAVSELFPGDAPALDWDAAMYPDCPGPLNLDAYNTHGLSLRETGQGVYRMYATAHGEREAIEAFELDATGDTPTATWVGCVPITVPSFTNSVAILSDGGFVATQFMDPTDPEAFAKLGAGEVSGGVFEWRPGGEVTMLPNTQLAGPNGIAVSGDDRYMFVAEFGGHRVLRYDREDMTAAPAVAEVGVTPDNLRWTEDGNLSTAGGNVIPDTGWSVWAIDPSTMAAGVLAGVDQTATLQGASTALQVGNEIWIGTFNGDRLGYFLLP